MLRSLSKRWFAFKPAQSLPFVDGKCRVLENPAVGSAATRISALFTLSTVYMGSRLVRLHAEMGWLSLSFQSLVFLGLGSFTLAYHNMMKQMVTGVDLLDTGKTIEVRTSGFFGMSTTVQIDVKNIIDPTETPTGKMYMAALKSWVILTKKQTLLISNTATLFHKEVLEAILKGEEIDVSDKVESENIIDI